MSARRAREVALVVAVLAVAAALRVPFVLTGLWRDEAATYFETTAPTFARAMREIALAEISPPGYFLVMRAWIGIAGVSDIAYKLPSFAFGLATIVLTYILARRLRSHAAGIAAAALASVTMSGVMLSGTARPYALAAALTALFGFVALETLRRGSWRFALTAACVAYALMEVQYTGIVVVASFAFVAAIRTYAPELRRGAFCLLGAAAVAAIAYVPQIPLFIHTAIVSVPWLPTLARPSIAGRAIEQFTYVLPFEVARTALALECVVPALVLAIVYRKRLLASDYPILILPVLVATALETKALLLHPRYMYAYSPLADAVLGAALVALVARIRSVIERRRWDRTALATTAFVAALVATLGPAIPKQTVIDYQTIGAPALSGMRDVVRDVPLVLDSHTLVVMAPDYLAPSFAYYARGHAVTLVGFPHRFDPQHFRWDHYGDAWQAPDALPSGERFVLGRFDARFMRLALLTDPRVIDRGTLHYSIVRTFERDLEQRLDVVRQAEFPGRDEAVKVTVFARRAPDQRRPSRSRT